MDCGQLSPSSKDSGDTSGYTSSNSEGEYILQDTTSSPDTRKSFDFSGWNPAPPAGLHYMGLIPFQPHYSINEFGQYPQKSHESKIKVSADNRRKRLKAFNPISNLIHDGRKLMDAAESNDKTKILELVDSGVDPSLADSKQRTALHVAAAKGHIDTVRILLEHGANPNKRDKVGNTPLHLAACTSRVDVVTVLLKAGTDIHSLDKSGKTPLHLAISKLKIINENKHFTSEQVKTEVSQIIKMMRAYLVLSGGKSEVEELDTICKRLQTVNTSDDVVAVNSLLEQFTNLTLQKQKDTFENT